MLIKISAALVLIYALVQSVPQKNTKCYEDADCPKDYYCHCSLKGAPNECVPCINCTEYMRLQPEGQCAKMATECGTCLDGFEHHVLSEDREADKCVPMSKSNVDKCYDDSDCDKNFYCHCSLKGAPNECVPCINCTEYMRLQPVGQCAKMATECGTCWDGYEHQVLAEGREADKCVLMKPKTTVDKGFEQDSATISGPTTSSKTYCDAEFWTGFALGCLVGALLAIVVTILREKYWKVKRNAEVPEEVRLTTIPN